MTKELNLDLLHKLSSGIKSGELKFESYPDYVFVHHWICEESGYSIEDIDDEDVWELAQKIMGLTNAEASLLFEDGTCMDLITKTVQALEQGNRLDLGEQEFWLYGRSRKDYDDSVIEIKINSKCYVSILENSAYKAEMMEKVRDFLPSQPENIDLLTEVLEGIFSGELDHSQEFYFCGTKSCVAGWICRKSVSNAKTKLSGYDVWNYAQKLIGLSCAEAELLFNSCSTKQLMKKVLEQLQKGNRLYLRQNYMWIQDTCPEGPDQVKIDEKCYVSLLYPNSNDLGRVKAFLES